MKIISCLAAASVAIAAVPAIAQDEEQSRTTYAVTSLDLAPGAEARWVEIMEDHYIPARKAAGLDAPTIHYVMAGPHDLLIISKMPRGMASMDTHANPEGAAFQAALIKLEGSKEAATKLRDEMRTLVSGSSTIYTHTHP
jgi:hypothetical protein